MVLTFFIATFGETVEKVSFKDIENTVFAVSAYLSEALNGGCFKKEINADLSESGSAATEPFFEPMKGKNFPSAQIRYIFGKFKRFVNNPLVLIEQCFVRLLTVF